MSLNCEEIDKTESTQYTDFDRLSAFEAKLINLNDDQQHLEQNLTDLSNELNDFIKNRKIVKTELEFFKEYIHEKQNESNHNNLEALMDNSASKRTGEDSADESHKLERVTYLISQYNDSLTFEVNNY